MMEPRGERCQTCTTDLPGNAAALQPQTMSATAVFSYYCSLCNLNSAPHLCALSSGFPLALCPSHQHICRGWQQSWAQHSSLGAIASGRLHWQRGCGAPKPQQEQLALSFSALLLCSSSKRETHERCARVAAFISACSLPAEDISLYFYRVLYPHLICSLILRAVQRWSSSMHSLLGSRAGQ